MSVLIKGMRMPEKGFVDVRLFADGRATTQSGESPYYKEMDVVEISEPHGDLIDRNMLDPDSEYEDGDFWTVSVAQIKLMPSVIEAEGSEDE